MTQTRDIIRQLKKVAAVYGYRLENHHQAVADRRKLKEVYTIWDGHEYFHGAHGRFFKRFVYIRH